MKDKVVIAGILILTFIAFFLGTTALTDSICRMNGYYSIGMTDEQELEHEYQ